MSCTRDAKGGGLDKRDNREGDSEARWGGGPSPCWFACMRDNKGGSATRAVRLPSTRLQSKPCRPTVPPNPHQPTPIHTNQH